MTPEERKAVRAIAGKNGGDLTKAAVTWLASVSGEGNTIEADYKADPNGFAASIGGIVSECELMAEADGVKAAKAGGK